MEHFNIDNLPFKTDFCVDNEIVIRQLKSNYLAKYNEWMKYDVKEHYIDIKTSQMFCLIGDDVKNSIYKLFSELGFKNPGDIEICEFSDTHKMYVRLKIY